MSEVVGAGRLRGDVFVLWNGDKCVVLGRDRGV